MPTTKTKTRGDTLAYCWGSGLIGFTDGKLPGGALPIARGPDRKIRDLIDGRARHGYDTRVVDGRPQKIPGTDCLLVPGIPEAPDQLAGVEALQKFIDWIGGGEPFAA